MKRFGEVTIGKDHVVWDMDDSDYDYVIDRYVKFYETENKCSGRCPMGLDCHTAISDGIRSRLTRDEFDKGRKDHAGFLCYCIFIKEFDGLADPELDRWECPCGKYGDEAFDKLEMFIKRVVK